MYSALSSSNYKQTPRARQAALGGTLRGRGTPLRQTLYQQGLLLTQGTKRPDLRGNPPAMNGGRMRLSRNIPRRHEAAGSTRSRKPKGMQLAVQIDARIRPN
jgi:hypothetical protein